MRTPVCDLLDIEFPILAFSHCRDVVAAVSKAGGLGVLGAIAYSPEGLETELRWIEKEIGDKPYGVDVLLPVTEGEKPSKSAQPSELIPATHIEFTLALLRENGIETTREELW